MRITFFSQVFWPDIATTAVIMNDLAQDLVSLGTDVTMVCAQPTWISRQSCPRLEVLNHFVIKRVQSCFMDKNNLVKRLVNSTGCMLAMLMAAMRLKDQDLLVFNTNPALLPVMGLFLKKLSGQNYCILVHDLWPELPANMNLIRRSGLLYATLDRLMTRAFANASGLMVISTAMGKNLARKVPQRTNRIHVLPNWADPERIFPVTPENNPMLDEIGLKGKKIILYAGNIGRYQPMEVMIHAAMILNSRKDIVFVFAGNGGKKRQLQQYARSNGLNNVMFLPFQPMERVSYLLSLAHVSLVGMLPENEGVIFPSKVYGLLAVGRPIVCLASKGSELADLVVRKARAGLNAPVDAPWMLAMAIVSIVDDPETATEMGNNGRRHFLAHFQRNSLTARWHQTLKTIVSLYAGQHKEQHPTPPALLMTHDS